MNFKSTVYEYLVVQGTTRAQYKGKGTINGSGEYHPDRFRIKITLGADVVYDNQMGALESDDPNLVPATALGGGSIVIHTK